MSYSELKGFKDNFGFGTSLLKVTATGFTGDVTVKDENNNTIATKPLVDGKTEIPVTASGALIISCTGATPQVINVTQYGTYNVILTDTVVYTLRIAISNSAPASRCEYLDDCAGFTPAKMNFNTGEFEYGSWRNAFFMPKPCMVKTDGTIDYFLDPDDYTKKENGDPSDVADLNYDGNAFVAVPTTYMKCEEIGGYRYIHISNKKAAAGYEAYAHHDKNGNVMPYTFWPIYMGYKNGTKTRSISGTTPTVSTTAAQERAAAQANGDIYDIETYADFELRKNLCYLMGRSTNTQDVFGYGRCASGNTNAIANGTMNTKGLFWGSNDQTSGVKVFGIENPWGNLWRRIVGLMASAAAVYVKMTRGTEDGSTVAGYSDSSVSGMISAGVTMGGTSGGYINACDTKEYAIIGKTASGSETTYECDGLWFSASSGTYMAFVGGNWSFAGKVGAGCVYLSSAPSISDANAGAALSCKPLVQ